MKSKTANAYIQATIALQAAKVQVHNAKIAIVADVQKQVSDILDALLPTYPELQYINRQGIVGVTHNNAKKRPKPEAGGLFFSFWVNPYWTQYGLDKSMARAISIAHHSEHDLIVETIINRLEEKGEWKIVKDSKFRYSNGPTLGVYTNWAMIPA